ncbi:hypothetical protein [Candidatus Ichthyocystis sparus]|uniref:hypothetical protein n=1 Tax=Candidatus Ichthyocystis sparus TaxID=1561004 RepID=UPI00159EE12E|nr:hypothetical protein [Candidatus Ichthyocystis sparus]
MCAYLDNHGWPIIGWDACRSASPLMKSAKSSKGQRLLLVLLEEKVPMKAENNY